MIAVEVRNKCADASSFRAASVKSLFNAEGEHDGTSFQLDAELPDPGGDWRIGVVVGPSGSGKSSIGRLLTSQHGFAEQDVSWPADAPIIDGIAPGADLKVVTGALGQVGLGDVPAWLRPYRVLSTGQQFRADLARVVADPPARVVVDEFTSVVDRQIAQVGAGAFAKGWRRGKGEHAVLLTCHYDVLDWLEPDWSYDTATGTLTWGSHHRPRIEVEVRRGGWDLWGHFKPHHYLDSGPMPGAHCYVGYVGDEPVVHLGMGTKNVGNTGGLEARACRMVVMPEWQGAGVGMRFLNHVCELQRQGEGASALAGRRVTTVFHTSHPLLAASLRRDSKWRQLSGTLHGAHRGKSQQSLSASAGEGKGRTRSKNGNFSHSSLGYGGHFRAVQGFRYVGAQP